MKKEINENKALSQTSVSGSFTVEDMIGFADWCRNGLLNTEYSIDRIHEHLEAWILQHRKQTLSEPTHFGQNTSQAIAVICCYVMVLN